MKIKKLNLAYDGGEVGALMTWLKDAKPSVVAVFTHGYTSHKGSLLSWSMRLSELGVASLIFDLPGHYLGTFSEIGSFQSFTEECPKLFLAGYKELKSELGFLDKEVALVLGGHSLGALMSLKASENPELNQCREQSLFCVGFGLPPEGVTHVFDTPFYKATLDARSQLVSPELPPEVIFPWIKEQKKTLDVKGRRVFLLTGEDDVVVGEKGTEELAKILESHGNSVVLEKPGRLAHHVPENAAPHLKKMFRDYKII